MALGIYNGIVSDNAQNRVLLPVSNSKSLAFDGSDDHLTTAADSTLATKTYSWWSQSADTGINGVFDHGDYNIGAFIFNYSSNKPLLYMAADWFRYWNDTSCQDDGSFHHYMLLLHTNISNCRLFCDGVEQTVQSTATGSGAGTSYTTGLRIGRAGTNYFSGHIEEFAVLDGDQTKLVADLYNSGVPTNIGQYAALQHWWRMGDATSPAVDGTSSLIYDQAGSSNATMTNMASSDIVQYTPNSYILSDLGITPDLAVSMTRKLMSDYSADLYATSGSDITAIFDQSDGSLGSELLTGFTNGSTYPFDTFAASGTSITSAIETSGNWGGAASNSFSVTSGEVYKVTFDLTYNSGSDTLRVVFADNANGAATQRSNIYYTNSNGVNTAYLTASATDETAYLQIGTWHSSDVVNFSASNISVKKVNGKHLTNYDHADVGNDAQLSGSGNSARATFSSVDNTVLTTSTLGSAFPAGNHDVFMVFDPVGTDQQILFGRASTGGDFLAMDNGSSSDAASGITIGEIRVNDTILPATVSRDELWDAMTVSGTMSGLNVLSLEDVDLSTIGGDIRLGASNNTWRLEGSFAEFIITPPLSDADHSAIVDNIRAHYDAP